MYFNELLNDTLISKTGFNVLKVKLATTIQRNGFENEMEQLKLRNVSLIRKKYCHKCRTKSDLKAYKLRPIELNTLEL